MQEQHRPNYLLISSNPTSFSVEPESRELEELWLITLTATGNSVFKIAFKGQQPAGREGQKE